MSLGFDKSPCQPDGIKKKSLKLDLGSACINSTGVMLQILAGKAFGQLFKAGVGGGGVHSKGKKERGNGTGGWRQEGTELFI